MRLAHFGVGKTGACLELGCILSSEVEFCARLKDQALGDALIVVAFELAE